MNVRKLIDILLIKALNISNEESLIKAIIVHDKLSEVASAVTHNLRRITCNFLTSQGQLIVFDFILVVYTSVSQNIDLPWPFETHLILLIYHCGLVVLDLLSRVCYTRRDHVVNVFSLVLGYCRSTDFLTRKMIRAVGCAR